MAVITRIAEVLIALAASFDSHLDAMQHVRVHYAPAPRAAAAAPVPAVVVVVPAAAGQEVEVPVAAPAPLAVGRNFLDYNIYHSEPVWSLLFSVTFYAHIYHKYDSIRQPGSNGGDLERKAFLTKEFDRHVSLLFPLHRHVCLFHSYDTQCDIKLGVKSAQAEGLKIEDTPSTALALVKYTYFLHVFGAETLPFQREKDRDDLLKDIPAEFSRRVLAAVSTDTPPRRTGRDHHDVTNAGGHNAGAVLPPLLPVAAREAPAAARPNTHFPGDTKKEFNHFVERELKVPQAHASHFFRHASAAKKLPGQTGGVLDREALRALLATFVPPARA